MQKAPGQFRPAEARIQSKLSVSLLCFYPREVKLLYQFPHMNRILLWLSPGHLQPGPAFYLKVSINISWKCEWRKTIYPSSVGFSLRLTPSHKTVFHLLVVPKPLVLWGRTSWYCIPLPIAVSLFCATWILGWCSHVSQGLSITQGMVTGISSLLCLLRTNFYFKGLLCNRR